MVRNVRITKRDIKEDKFTTFVLQSKDKVAANWIWYAGGLAVIILLIAAVFWYTDYSQNQMLEAAEIYSRAELELSTNNFQLAIVDFKAVVDNFGSTPQAQYALFNLGNAYFGSKDYVEAINAFQAYLDKYRNKDIIFTTSAMAGIAASLAGNGDLIAAADKYREIAETYPDFELAAHYFVKAMDHYLKADNIESAKVVYAKLLKDYEDSRFTIQGKRLAGEYGINL